MYPAAPISYFFKNFSVAAPHPHLNPNPHLCFLDLFSCILPEYLGSTPV